MPVASLALYEGESLPLHQILILVDIFGPFLVFEEIMADFSRMSDASIDMLVFIFCLEFEGGG